MMIVGFSGIYAFLSNFWYTRVFYEGVNYPSVEHAYQAAKTMSIVDRDIIKGLTVAKAKRHGRIVPMRTDWEHIKNDVMLDLLRQKFKLNKALQQKLLATGELVILEGNFWHDNYWGVCGCSQCAVLPAGNYLGLLLMQVRTEIRQELAIDKG